MVSWPELATASASVFEMIHTDASARDASGAVVMDESTLAKRLAVALGNDTAKAESCVAAASSAEVKELLKTNTSEALELGAFGAPYMVISGASGAPEEMLVFGSDRFEQVAWAIRRPWLGPDPSRPSVTSSL